MAIIDEAVNIDTSLFKQKSVSLSWEYVFTKSLYQTSDILTQGEFLDLIAGLSIAKLFIQSQEEDLNI